MVALAEKGLKYELKKINFLQSEHKVTNVPLHKRITYMVSLSVPSIFGRDAAVRSLSRARR